MTSVILFIFGLAIGSFLNVVALRYDGEKFLFDTKAIGGRSYCPHCKNTLRWYELIPLVSFIIQGGKCRSCKTKIGFKYPLAELLSGIVFFTVPLRFMAALAPGSSPILLISLSVIWILALEILLLIAYIDILLGIIPDELNIALVILGFISLWFMATHFGVGNPSFVGVFAAMFGLQANIWINHILAAIFGALFFGALVAVTRGRGMGMGDVKLALPLGLLFGWPDVLVLAGIAFITGALVGVFAVTIGKKTMKGAVPFAPFLVLGAAAVFFWGSILFQWYFRLMGLQL